MLWIVIWSGNNSCRFGSFILESEFEKEKILALNKWIYSSRWLMQIAFSKLLWIFIKSLGSNNEILVLFQVLSRFRIQLRKDKRKFIETAIEKQLSRLSQTMHCLQAFSFWSPLCFCISRKLNWKKIRPEYIIFNSLKMAAFRHKINYTQSKCNFSERCLWRLTTKPWYPE